MIAAVFTKIQWPFCNQANKSTIAKQDFIGGGVPSGVFNSSPLHCCTFL